MTKRTHIMEILAILGEILPVFGTIGLLGLWLYQQTEVENRSGMLKQIYSAKSTYQMYQSHNAIFNAINETIDAKKKSSVELRRFQTYNYELGLQALEEVLTKTEKKGILKAIDPYTGEDEQKIIENTQKRLEKLQDKIKLKENQLLQSSKNAKRKYFLWYIAFSVISITGAVLKVTVKLN